MIVGGLASSRLPARRYSWCGGGLAFSFSREATGGALPPMGGDG